MKIVPIATILLILVLAQCCCWENGNNVVPSSSLEPTKTESVPPTDSPSQAIGTILNLKTRVQAGTINELKEIDTKSELQNNDGIKVTNGGKARLEFSGPIFLLVYNDSEMEGVTAAEVETGASSPRYAARLIRGGMTGYVSPGTELTINLESGMNVTVLGTNFFIIDNENNGYVTIGKFDGKLNLSIPNWGNRDLADSEMVDISPDGSVMFFPIPFSVDDLDKVATDNASSVVGMNLLREQNQIPTQGSTPMPTSPPLPASANPSNYSGVCPKDVVFSGAITMNTAGTATYYWEKSDGSNTPTEELSFSAGGNQNVSLTWSITSSGSYWARLQVTKPNQIASKEVKVRIACENKNPGFATNPPQIDGHIAPGEWENAILAATLNHTEVRFLNDTNYLYVGVEVVGDTTDDLGTDQLWITLDVNKNQQPDEYVDFNYYVVQSDGSTNIWEQLIGKNCGSLWFPEGTPHPTTKATAAIGFGGTPFYKDWHTTFELRLPLSEIQAIPGEDILFGITVRTEDPPIFESVPDLCDWAKLVRYRLVVSK